MIHTNKKIRTQKGFTMVELIIVLAIIAGLAAIILPKVSSDQASGQVAAAQQILMGVKDGAVKFKPWNGDMTGISMQAMQDLDQISEQWGNGSGILPWGGNVTVAVDPIDNTRVVVTFDGIDSDGVGNQMVRNFDTFSASGTNASYGSGSFSITLLGQ